MNLERIIRISGAYNGTAHPRNYGISSMGIWMAVKGPKGGISCAFSTSWYLPQNQAASFSMFAGGYPFDPLVELMAPKGTDISYHSKVPTWESADFEQTPLADCVLTDGPCYCDGSSLDAQERWQPVFLHEGSDGIFERLEQYYLHQFEGAPFPDMTPKPRTFPNATN